MIGKHKHKHECQIGNNAKKEKEKYRQHRAVVNVQDMVTKRIWNCERKRRKEHWEEGKLAKKSECRPFLLSAYKSRSILVEATNWYM